jgi:hypothetical protein
MKTGCFYVLSSVPNEFEPVPFTGPAGGGSQVHGLAGGLSLFTDRKSAEDFAAALPLQDEAGNDLPPVFITAVRIESTAYFN